MRPNCTVCGKPAANKGRLASGDIKWSKHCNACQQKARVSLEHIPKGPKSLLCSVCGLNTREKKGGTYADGSPKLSSYCWKCKKARSAPEKLRERTRRNRERMAQRARERIGSASLQRYRYLKDECERCGFEPEVMRQLQLDHIDGNRANNHPSNLQTLCANCHALKTVRNGDDKTPSRQPTGVGVQRKLFN